MRYLLVTAVLMLAASASVSGAEEAKQRSAKQVESFVEKAAALVEQEGAKAFAEFNKKDSKWFQGNTYVFVDSRKGEFLCYPPMPSKVGTNIVDFKDTDGREVFKLELAKVTSDKAGGWIHYRWPKPGEEKPSWKRSYVKLVKGPEGKEYIVGSGLYAKKTEKEFLVDTVDHAAALVAKEGKDAFPTLRDKKGPFRYANVYVYITDMNDGTALVNAAFPKMEGTNMLGLKDANGKPLVKDTIEMLKKNETGWINYMWPKPGETKPSKKMSYVRRVKIDGKLAYIGAGMYLD
jgi:signal transduction histidine kinase